MGHNGGQDVGQSNERTKVPTNAQQRHHKQRLRQFEKRCKKQKQLAEEFVISLLYTAEDQRRDICELTNG